MCDSVNIFAGTTAHCLRFSSEEKMFQGYSVLAPTLRYDVNVFFAK